MRARRSRGWRRASWRPRCSPAGAPGVGGRRRGRRRGRRGGDGGAVGARGAAGVPAKTPGGDHERGDAQRHHPRSRQDTDPPPTSAPSDLRWAPSVPAAAVPEVPGMGGCRAWPSVSASRRARPSSPPSASAGPSGWATGSWSPGRVRSSTGGRCPDDAGDAGAAVLRDHRGGAGRGGRLARRRRAHAHVHHVGRGRRRRRRRARRAPRARAAGGDHGRRGGTAGPRLEGGDRSRGGAALSDEAVLPSAVRAPYEASPATVAATMLVPRRSPTRPDSMRFMT